MEQFDVVIVGAGPAGTSCALSLRNSGLNILLIEKQKHPRDKICGDAIPGPAFRAMRAIDPVLEKEMKAFAQDAFVHTSAGVFPGGKEIIKKWKLFSYNVKRLDFDNFLMGLVRKNTHTTIWEHTKVKDVLPSDNKTELLLDNGNTISALFLIACDGANSIVSRKLSKHDYHDHPYIVAVRAYFDGIEGLEKGKNEFHFIKKILPAYFWIFPLGNGRANVGFGKLKNTQGMGSEKQNMKELLNHIIKTDLVLAPRFEHATLQENIKGYSLPIASKSRKISGKRFVLCGDAASLIDPITGSGIDTAMWSGHFAAQQVIKSNEAKNFTAEFIRQYDDEVNRKIGSKFKTKFQILRTFNQFPFLFRLLFRLVKSDYLVRLINKHI